MKTHTPSGSLPFGRAFGQVVNRARIARFLSPNLTIWSDAGYGFPKNRLKDTVRRECFALFTVCANMRHTYNSVDRPSRTRRHVNGMLSQV